MMDRSGGPAASADGDLNRVHQGLIDAEMRASRRAVLAEFRHRLRTDPQTLVAGDFLAVADRSVVRTAIIIAAGSVADARDLQIPDPRTGLLRMVRYHGLPPAFLRYFAAVNAAVPSPYGTALATGEPVLIDDITTSVILAGQPTLDVMLAAGIRALHSYPLHDRRGALLGMLTLHYRTVGRRPGRKSLARAATQALTEVEAQAPAPAEARSGEKVRAVQPGS
ncbi:GAF domain-containing protein [Actinoplanes sp. URMC 104]|uniref:GAF domain-containing protein n=1 Tax=Actinoplanes sp. URMC 104 TaxID=3423409 RepID=UPI003F1B1F66